MKNKIIVQNIEVSMKDDYISLTDVARSKNPDEPKDVVKNWLRSKNTIEFLGFWEKVNNINFKGVEFDSFKNEAGSNSFTLSPTTAKQWQEQNSKLTGNLRDYVSVEQLVVLANLENLNAEFIKQNFKAEDRLKRLNQIAMAETGYVGSESEFFNSKVIKDLDEFKKMSDVIVANRLENSILDVKDKVYTRDIFNSDS